MMKRLAIDFDGTLTVGDNKWWEDDSDPKPNLEMIKKVNEKFIQGHTILIFTARPWEVARKTVAWLIKYGVRFHGVNFNKMPAHVYVDDRMKSLEDFKK